MANMPAVWLPGPFCLEEHQMQWFLLTETLSKIKQVDLEDIMIMKKGKLAVVFQNY